MPDTTWMIYGSSGYTGALCAEAAAARGEKPILAGRREEAVRPIAERLGLPWRAFELGDAAAVDRGLAGVRLVLHCAGPFSATSQPMVEGCLRARAHYLDVTGEVVVFEACAGRDAEAKAAGIVILPGVGFDVVPSDCLAATLKRALPGAVRLELAFAGMSGVSRGTAKTMAEGLGKRGAVREDGVLKTVPHAYKQQQIAFRDRSRHCVTIPWGDISTAYRSTGIPNIEVYLAASKGFARMLKVVNPVAPLFERPFVQRLVKRVIDRQAPGPTAEQRERGRTQLWGRVTDAGGMTASATLVTPEGYRHTVDAALECAARVRAGGVPAGALTPSMAFGADFVTTLPGCDLQLSARA